MDKTMVLYSEQVMQKVDRKSNKSIVARCFQVYFQFQKAAIIVGPTVFFFLSTTLEGIF